MLKEEENLKPIVVSYRLKFIDSARFIASSLSNLFSNLAKGIRKIKCQYGYDNKTCEECGITYKGCECCLEYVSVKDDLIVYIYLCCDSNYLKRFDEDQKKGFSIRLL